MVWKLSKNGGLDNSKFERYIYLDLPKGAKWFLKGVNSPFLYIWNILEGAGNLIFCEICAIDLEKVHTP